MSENFKQKKMKTSKMTKTGFTDLSPAELLAIGGEGFAYDAGRLVRFLGNCGLGSIGVIYNAVDFALYQAYKQTS